MPIKTIDHIYLETRHFEKSMAFWEALGFVVGHRWGENGHRACQLQAKEARLVLAEVESEQERQGPTTHLRIEEAEAFADRLRDSPEVDVVTSLEPTHWGTRWLRARTPDGDLFCFEE